jgi:hypothetical protein
MTSIEWATARLARVLPRATDLLHPGLKAGHGVIAASHLA